MASYAPAVSLFGKKKSSKLCSLKLTGLPGNVFQLWEAVGLFAIDREGVSERVVKMLSAGSVC